jgi:hypothetical protein
MTAPLKTAAAIAAVFGIYLSNTPAAAQDASFGCKVLLCAAAASPNWRGIPYCVPVMSQLLQMMSRRGFRWPVCAEAGTGAPGHEPYDACPAETTPVTISADGSPSQMCAKPRPNASAYPVADAGSLDADSLKQRYELTPRPQRAEPYYFDVRDNGEGGGTKRVYFSLQ